MPGKECKKLGPCDNCPFRNDRPGYLPPERGEEIWSSLENGQSFLCHKTLEHNDDGELMSSLNSRFCNGALILMEREFGEGGAAVNQMVRIHGRLGMLDLNQLDMDAPVPEDSIEWFDHLQESEDLR